MAIGGDFPPGAYLMTYEGVSVGLMEGSIKTQQQWIAQQIRTALFAQSVIALINQGRADFIAFMVKEWHAGARAAMWQFGASLGECTQAGTIYTGGALVLTAVAGSPAAALGPVTRTYPNALLLPGHNMEVTFGPEERNVPIVMMALPDQASGGGYGTKVFTDT